MTTSVLEKRLRRFESPARSHLLRWLLSHFPPQQIVNSKMHHAYLKGLEILMTFLQHENLAQDDRKDIEHFISLITPLVADYENKRIPVGASDPEEVLKFLMEQHRLTQKDIAAELGGQPVVSAILAGKRRLSRDQIEALSRRFKISPASFFPSAV